VLEPAMLKIASGAPQVGRALKTTLAHLEV
jgi:hypothetical protein